MQPAVGPDSLPDILDLLVVGGGPSGTAAAFRARELGLSALVIDYDDLMKRIRDYAKDKLILPHFGGGDKMGFPEGGDLVRELHFSPIDKDEMCVTWKALYDTHNIPARTGIELTGIERRDDGVWQVQTWNHKAKSEEVFLARHIALAIGRGVPRRFDIPGSTDGIAYRLDEATHYIGHPVCVIGGGTSAAEAVIALSEAKAEAGDTCSVYWSYRGAKLPKVSRALADAFFNAYLGNGNIRYYPGSEPAAVVTTPDREENLSIRVDRKAAEGRPHETVHLEFDKTHCIACIGEDIPEALLNSLGIYLVTGGPSNKKRMVVTPLLETQQPNVYMIGDLLSQAYLETDDFTADPTTFHEIKHRGNIKTALRDGVFVAEVVKQKLDGREVIQVDLTFADDDSTAAPSVPAPRPASAAPSSAPAPSTPIDDGQTMLRPIVAPQGMAEPPVEPERAVEESDAFLVRVTASGVEEDEFALDAHGVTTIGRHESMLSFPEDTLLADAHASVSRGPDGFVLRDDGSETGTFLQLRAGKVYPLATGDLLRLGQRFLLFQADDGRFEVAHHDRTGQLVGRHTLTEGTIVLGRQAPDITLDPGDRVLSRRHLALALKDGVLLAKDLKSLNGTYLRVRDAIEIDHDDVFRVGQQILKLSLKEEEAVKPDSTTFRVAPFASPKPTPPAPPSPASPATPPAAPASPTVATTAAAPTPTATPAPASAPADEASVTFKGDGESIPVGPGQTVCEAAEAAGMDLNAECHAGICGSDAVRIVSGGEYLDAPGDEESGTLEDICDVEPGNAPGRCRLACMMRTTGPVVVERI